MNKFLRYNTLFLTFIVSLHAIAQQSVPTQADTCLDSKDYREIGIRGDENYASGTSLFPLSNEQRAIVKLVSPEMSQETTKADLMNNENIFGCDNNSEGQGTGNSIYVQLNGTSCIVRHDISYEYGNDEDPLGFYSFSTDLVGAFSCKVVGLLNLDGYGKGINFEVSRFNHRHVLSCFSKNFEKSAAKLVEFCKAGK